MTQAAPPPPPPPGAPPATLEPAGPTAADRAAVLEQALFEVKKVIVGQDQAIERLLTCLLARGHVLLEGVPGVAKTLASETLARVVGGSFVRIQFTPDLLPADIVGTLQIDTPINPGNSGGPVANRDGEIIGIASFIQSQTGGSVGLGFAIPMDIAEQVADALVAREPVEFGYLGIEGGDAAGAQAGALIANVQPGSPAEDAGLQDGDLVVEADGEPIGSFGDLGVVIRSHDPGDELALVVNRDGEEQQVTATLGSTADQ
ncbi:MAG TPA: AAA family ATPase [Acidimicrobiales bacterium]|nr:AAA family ATPase [Acidimicrobiales bacterium]